MSRAAIFVDSMDTASEKSGDLLMAISEGAIELRDVRAELGDVIAGVHPGRSGGTDITLFNSVGIGMQDLAIGGLLYNAATERGLGLSVSLNS